MDKLDQWIEREDEDDEDEDDYDEEHPWDCDCIECLGYEPIDYRPT